MCLPPHLMAAHPAGMLQKGEVFGDRGLRHARLVGQSVHGLFAVPAQSLENGTAGRVGEDA